MSVKIIFEEMKEKYTFGSAVKAGIVFEQWQWKMIVKGDKK
jgi:hypothetical protein